MKTSQPKGSKAPDVQLCELDNFQSPDTVKTNNYMNNRQGMHSIPFNKGSQFCHAEKADVSVCMSISV